VAKSSLFQRVQAIPFHPLLFAVYPVLALMGININEVEPVVLWRPLFVLLLSVAFLLLLFGLFSRDWHRAAFLLSIFIFLFFTYGHVYAYLKKIDVDGFILGRHRQMLPLWVGLAVLAVWWVMRKLPSSVAHARLKSSFSISANLSDVPDRFVCHSKGASRKSCARSGPGKRRDPSSWICP
jgi:hypothetical protein